MMVHLGWCINSEGVATVSSDRSELVALIKSDALRFGDFTLASGAKSKYYIDCRDVTLQSKGAALIGRAILDLLADEPIDAVGGMTLGADPILSAVLTLAGVDGRPMRGFIVRKEPKDHGTGKLVEGPLKPGDRVAIVEDVSTTGGSALKAARAAEAAGARVEHIICVLDRLSGGREAFESAGYRFTPLVTIRDLGIEN